MVESGSYLIAYWDAEGNRQEVNSGTTDRDAAEQIARKLESEAALRKRGVIDVIQERFAVEGRRPIAEHVAEFRAALTAKGNTSKHAELTDARVKFVVAKAGVARATDLTPSTVQQVIKGIHDAGRSLETVNSYVRAIKSFTRAGCGVTNGRPTIAW